MATFLERLRMASIAGVTAFREAYLNADTLDQTDVTDWSSFEARKLRYDMLWAYFQGNAYRDIHTWARKMRADFGLYKYTRDIYNPAFQLGSFEGTAQEIGIQSLKAGMPVHNDH